MRPTSTQAPDYTDRQLALSASRHGLVRSDEQNELTRTQETKAIEERPSRTGRTTVTILGEGIAVDLQMWARQWVDANGQHYTRRQHLAAQAIHAAVAQAFRSMGNETRALPHEAIADEHLSRAQSLPVVPAREWSPAAQVKLLRRVGGSR
jgi:hypothetical protein